MLQMTSASSSPDHAVTAGGDGVLGVHADGSLHVVYVCKTSLGLVLILNHLEHIYNMYIVQHVFCMSEV